jgi:diacylglycerol kinase (ATP)
MKQEAVKLERFSVGARIRSFRFAARGIWATLSTQHNAWIHAVATLAAVVAGVVLGISRAEWLAVVLAIMAVWTAEALNTAFEALCNVASPEFHPLVARAKDVAAGAVLISAIGAFVIGVLVFGPRLFALWARG